MDKELYEVWVVNSDNRWHLWTKKGWSFNNKDVRSFEPEHFVKQEAFTFAKRIFNEVQWVHGVQVVRVDMKVDKESISEN